MMNVTTCNQLSSSDSIQIRIDEFLDSRSNMSKGTLEDVYTSQQRQQKQQKQQKQNANFAVPGKPSHEGSQEGSTFLGVRESCRRERRNSWCSTRPSEALANLKRKCFAAVSSNANGKFINRDDSDDGTDIKCKSFSLTSLDNGDDFTSEDEKISTNQIAAIHHFEHQSASTMLSPTSAGFHGDDRYLGDTLFLGHCRNARSEQDVRGRDEKNEDKMVDESVVSNFRSERFSLETEQMFALKTVSPAKRSSSPGLNDGGKIKQSSSSYGDGNVRCPSPTPSREKSIQSAHPNLDLLVARHKSEGSLQRFPVKELKQPTQRKSSVLSKINSYRNSKKNNKTPPVDLHNFLSILSSSSSSSLSPSITCDVCNKPFTSKKTLLKCMDCGLVTHQDPACKDHAQPCQFTADEQRPSHSNLKSEENSEFSNRQLNKGNSSTTTTTTDSDPLDLPDVSLDETDGVFSPSFPAPGLAHANSIIIAPGHVQDEEEEAWSLTVDDSILSAMTSGEIKRQNLIWELIKNEKHHFRILKMMLGVFVNGLMNEVGLDSCIVDQLFPGLEGLIAVHGNILKALLQQQTLGTDKIINDLSSVLLEQFGGSNGQQMELLYSDFCSKHERAINLFKDLKRGDKKFQNFINKCVGIVACERRGIDSCILTVTQRLTKYPLLVEQILKYTDNEEEERRGLSEFLQLVRSIISAVNDKVDCVAKKERFEEIFDKLDPKSTTTLGSRTIKRANILSMEKYLRFHGWIKLRTARGRSVDTLVVVLMDWIVFLTENNHKYLFSNIDNKSSIIPLSKLLVREKDDKHEGRHFFLISSNKDTTAEMYELVCKSNSELKYWTSVLRQATALSASKAESHVDLLPMLNRDQTHLISLIETLQGKDEEIKVIINLKMSAIGFFYKTFDKISPVSTLTDSTIKQMSAVKSQHLRTEELVRDVHIQETNLIAALQSSGMKDSKRNSFSNECSSQEGLHSRRPSSASLSSKASHSSSYRNIIDPNNHDLSFHNSSDVPETEVDVDSGRVKRKVSDASTNDSRFSAKTSLGMLPGFLSIFYKEKDELNYVEIDEQHQQQPKHRKQSSLTSPQLQFQPQSLLLQQQPNISNQQQQQSQLQSTSQQQSLTWMQQSTQQLNRISPQDQQLQQSQQLQQPCNNDQKKPTLTQESEGIICNYFNNVHSLSAAALDLSTDAKKKELQIIWLTKQVEKMEKQSYPLEQQLEELRRLQNQVQAEKFQVQELRVKHQEDVEKFSGDMQHEQANIDKQKAEIKVQKEELQRQKDALQRQIDLFEEQKLNFTSRMSLMMNSVAEANDLLINSTNVNDDTLTPTSIVMAKHERTHSNPMILSGKPFSAIFMGSNHPGRSCSPGANFSSLPFSNAVNNNNGMSTASKQHNSKHARSGLTSDLFKPPVDEKNGVLVTKKDSLPLLPVHLVSAKNEYKLVGHSVGVNDEIQQSGPIKQIFPKKLATTSSLTSKLTNSHHGNHQQHKGQQQQQACAKDTSMVEKKKENGDVKSVLSATVYGSKPGNKCNQLPMHLVEKTRVLPPGSHPQLHQLQQQQQQQLNSALSPPVISTAPLAYNSNNNKSTVNNQQNVGDVSSSSSSYGKTTPPSSCAIKNDGSSFKESNEADEEVIYL